MALGLAHMFNIRLTLNFNRPYAAANIRQFWRCWHITLTRWFTDYIYKPFSSLFEFSFQAKLIGVIIVFTFTSLWHGFGLRFLAWGFSHMVLVLVTFIPLATSLSDRMPKYVNWLATFFAINTLWLFFLFPFDKSIEVLGYLINPHSFVSFNGILFSLLVIFLLLISLLYNPSVLMLQNQSSEINPNFCDEARYSDNLEDNPEMILSSLSASITTKVNKIISGEIMISLILFISIIHFSFASTFIYFRF